MRILIIVFIWILLIYMFIIHNPLKAFLYTHNLAFAWIVLKAQFTMDEYEFAHYIWRHPLNKPFERRKK